MLIKHKTLAVIFVLFIFIVNSCNKDSQSNSSHLPKKEVVAKAYPKVLAAIDQRRKSYKKEFYENKSTQLLKAQNYLESQLVEEVLPLWLGTEWDYNGTTTTPRSGKIACGYFVTTTLHQVGFQFNRSLLAQQASLYILQSFCKEENIKRIGHNNTKALFNYLNNDNNKIYLCGLDNHVGYIIKQDGQWYAFHASGLPPYQVVKEPLNECPAYLQSQNFFIAPLFKEGYMLSSWILNVPVKILTA